MTPPVASPRPLVSSRGNLIAHRETNILVITDAASNVRRLLDIVRLVDVEVAIEELQIIPIRYADAGDLATILNQLFSTGRVRSTAVPGAAGAAPVPASWTAAGALGGKRELADSKIARDGLPAGAPAPDFRLPLLHGGELSLSEYQGRKVLLVFSDPNCDPCDKLAPQLDRLGQPQPATQRKSRR